MGGHELFHDEHAAPVRCIICNKIKQPLSIPVASELVGMRCDESCPGYTLDPPAVDGSMTFLERIDLSHRAAGVDSVAGAGDELIDVIGRALCEVHFGL